MKKEKDWLPDIKKLMRIVDHQKMKINDQEWIIHNLISTIDKIREVEDLKNTKKENNLKLTIKQRSYYYVEYFQT